MAQSDSLKINSVQIDKVIYTIIMSLFVLIWVSPILLTLITSIKTDKAVLTNPFSLPRVPIFYPYREAWNALRFDKLLFNSIVYSVGGTVLAIILAIFPAYAFTKFYVPAGSILFTILLVSLALPQQTFIIPLYDIMRYLKLLDTRLGLIIVHGMFGLPFELVIFTAFIKNIPQEIQDAARIDGSSNLGVLRYIIIPLSAPVIAVGFVINFIQIWKEYFFALIFLNKPALLPITVGILEITGDKYATTWNIPAAAIVITQLPMLIVFIVAHRWLIKGIFAGAVKQ